METSEHTEEPSPPEEQEPDQQNVGMWPYVGGGVVLMAILTGAALFVRSRRRRQEYERWQDGGPYDGDYDGYDQQPYDSGYGEEPYGYVEGGPYDEEEIPYGEDDAAVFPDASPYENNLSDGDREPCPEESAGAESDAAGDNPDSETEEPPPE